MFALVSTTARMGIIGEQSDKSPNESSTIKAAMPSTESCRVASPGGKLEQSKQSHIVCCIVNERFCLEPQMGFLEKFVIPVAAAYWESIAYSVLNYDVPVVDAIRQNHRYVQGCCRELFEDWLTTERGVKPKTWSKLLHQLREVKSLTSVTEAIEENLKQL